VSCCQISEGTAGFNMCPCSFQKRSITMLGIIKTLSDSAYSLIWHDNHYTGHKQIPQKYDVLKNTYLFDS